MTQADKDLMDFIVILAVLYVGYTLAAGLVGVLGFVIAVRMIARHCTWRG